MIDDKKIEEAAFKINNGISLKDKLMRAIFIAGAKWAINEFLKNLWHPASEEPRRNTIYLAQIGNCAFDTFFDNKDWEKFSKGNSITRWLYVGDLLPKGGE